jgi:hypothetical protein
MPDDAKTTLLSSIPLPGALAVLTALAGVLLLNYEPLEPRRPVEGSATSVVPGDTHRFNAAPGEDPLRSLARARLVEPDKTEFDPANEVQVHSPWGFFIELRDRLDRFNQAGGSPPPKPVRVLLMPVLIRPGTDIAAVEQRSRARSAVMAGLTSSGYVPENSSSLECCRLSPWPLQVMPMEAPSNIAVVTQTASASPLPGEGPPAFLDVPFEWFKSSSRIASVNSPRYMAVGVLWVRGDALGRTPLSELRTALHRLLHGYPRKVGLEQTREINAAQIEVALVGPHATEKLADFVGEAASEPKWRKDQWQGPLRLISPWATASARALLRISGENPSGNDAEKRVDDLMNQVLDPNGSQSRPFIRSLASDDYVANALVDELQLRGLKLRNTPDDDHRPGDVVIISEHDTSYGRELPLTFMEAITGGDSSYDFNNPRVRWHWISFPRGLDGRYSSETVQGAPDKNSRSSGHSDYSPDEVPIGVSQADALRRLAAQLEGLDQRLTRDGSKGLVAVGVLGGDVYDKLWILRALRPRLPRAQFFTNNLDAWLWQRDELRTTRNLIVGSPYGVTLADQWQMGKLPFRDSYQTSVYAAALAATKAAEPGLFERLRSTRAVRLFEIGREEPHDLSFSSDANTPHLHPEPDSRTWWQLPDRSHQAWWITIILVSAWLGWMVVSWLPGLGLVIGKKNFGTHWKSVLGKIAKSPVMVVVCMVIVSCWIESWWSSHPEWEGGEPLLFSAGISAWPAEAFRLMAVLLTLYLILKACAMLSDSTHQLRASYFARELDASTPAPRRSPLDWMKSMFLFWETNAVLTTRRGEEGIVHPVQLWSEYRLSNSITARLTRSIVVAALLFFGTCELLRLLGDPLPPVRGDHARHIDWWLDNLSLAALLWITAFVVDMLWLNRVFIRWFNRGRSDWPDDMLNAYSGSNLHADNLRDYIDLEMVADWTRDIGRLTFFPFYVLALLIFARTNRFDAWSWPSALIIVYAIVILLVILGAARVRSAAESLRSKAVAEVRQRYSPLVDDSAAAKLLREINGLRRGAFVPFSEQPVMKALYWLLGALGVGGLWQAFAQWL